MNKVLSYLGFTKPLKSYEITIDRHKLYRVSADSLQMLKEKASLQFKIENCRVLLADGTEIDNETSFSTIEPSTLFLIATDPCQVKTDVQLLLEVVQNDHFHSFDVNEMIETYEKIGAKQLVKRYQAKLKEMNEKRDASKRDEDIDWFAGVPETLKTKEAVMARRSQDRIRGYFHKARFQLKKSDIYKKSTAARRLIDELLEVFEYFLVGVDYFSSLFDRKCENRFERRTTHENIDATDAPKRKKLRKAQVQLTFDAEFKKDHCVSLCDGNGEFKCHGPFGEEKCTFPIHRINPYATREDAITFQMWNLDHQIEMTRTVIPKILDDVHSIVWKAKCKQHNRPAKMLSAVQYFLELFTMNNLRMVHIVCHNKVARKNSSKGRILCDECDDFKTLQNTMEKMKEIAEE